MHGYCVLLRLDGAPLDLAALRRAAAALTPSGGTAVHQLEGPVGLSTLARDGSPEPPHVGDGRRFVGVAAGSLARRDRLRDELAADEPLRPASIRRRRAAGLSDAGLVVAAYERWVDDCVLHLAGAWSFVLWDRRDRRLFAARDAAGDAGLHLLRQGPLLRLASLPPERERPGEEAEEAAPGRALSWRDGELTWRRFAAAVR